MTGSNCPAPVAAHIGEWALIAAWIGAVLASVHVHLKKLCSARVHPLTQQNRLLISDSAAGSVYEE